MLEMGCCFKYICEMDSKIEVLAKKLKYRGALLECFVSFPGFREHLEVLVKEGYAKVTSPETCEWLKSKTSLAEYFKWAFDGVNEVSGGFWAPLEKTFGIKRHSLRKLIGKHANACKSAESKDFRKIKPLLHKLREQQRTELLFQHIKHLILEEAGDETPEEIEKVMQKISSFFEKKVDKNV